MQLYKHAMMCQTRARTIPMILVRVRLRDMGMYM